MTDQSASDAEDERGVAEMVALALGHAIVGWTQAGIPPKNVMAGVAKGVAGAICDTSMDGSETHNLRIFAKAIGMLADHCADLDAQEAPLANVPVAGNA